MKTITESMTTPEFKKFVDFNELEVFTSAQVGQFATQVAIDIKKSMNGELDAQSVEGSKIELASMKPVNVVDNVGGSIVKSIFYVREKQVEEIIEKSENGESHKIKFLDTELNRKLNRVGETIKKSMCDKTIKKSDELDYYVRLKKNGVSNPREELKKSFNLDDEKADEIEKSFEDMLASKKEGKDDADKSEKKPEKKEGKEKEEDDEEDSKKGEKEDVELNLENDGKEVEKSLDSILEKINENFDKGLIDELTYNSAGEQLATIFEKALDKSKLTKKTITDKRGRRSSRWVRVNKEEEKEKAPKSEVEIEVGQKYHSPAPDGGEAIDFIITSIKDGKYTIETSNEDGRKGAHTFDEKTMKELVSESKLKTSAKETKTVESGSSISQKLHDELYRMIGDISANNSKNNKLNQDVIDKVYDSMDGKNVDYDKVISILEDYAANDRGSTIKEQAIYDLIDKYGSEEKANPKQPSKESKTSEKRPVVGKRVDEIKVGDKIKGSQGITKDRVGTIISIEGDMAQVDFGNGDKYGITLRRITEGEFKNQEKSSEEAKEKVGGSSPDKHFELDKSDSIKVGNSTLYRITATKDSLYAEKGEKGGYVEKPENISDDAWVFGDAKISGNARVSGKALVSGNAQVSGDAQVSGTAQVSGEAQIYGNARVYGNAWVYGKTLVSGKALVSGTAQVSGEAQIYGNAWVSGKAQVSGNARVSGKAQVSGNARVYDNAQVSGTALVSGKALVSGTAQVSGEAQIYGNAWVSGKALVSGNARVSGKAQVSGNARVYDNAQVSGTALVSGNARVYGNDKISDKTLIFDNAQVYGNDKIS
jgi:carbonic anhydrase/acetyltransferase-like protein (isoleucine patch superfamily)